MDISVAYGEGQTEFSVSSSRVIDVLQPGRGRTVDDIGKAVNNAIKKPVKQDALTDIIKADHKVVIVVDDNTRPTPSKDILMPILKTLNLKGVPSNNVTIIIANGAHKCLNKEEIISILGYEIYNKYTIENHDANNEAKLVFIGRTSFGTPVLINKKVVEADIRILTGLIKPHNQAGYSGGGKSILPGVCGLDTILANHSYKYVENSCSCIGNVNKNPIRKDIEEVLPGLGCTFIVNVVMNFQNEVIAVVAGDIIAAHRTGIKMLDQIASKAVKKRGKICICGTPTPIDINFYQMINSLSVAYRIKKPIIEFGGTIIVAGKASQGISDGDFYETLVQNDRNKIWENIRSGKNIFKESPALHIFLQGEKKYNIVVVSQESNRHLFQNMGITFYSNMQDAVDNTLRQYRAQKDIIVFPYGPYIIPRIH